MEHMFANSTGTCLVFKEAVDVDYSAYYKESVQTQNDCFKSSINQK